MIFSVILIVRACELPETAHLDLRCRWRLLAGVSGFLIVCTFDFGVYFGVWSTPGGGAPRHGPRPTPGGGRPSAERSPPLRGVTLHVAHMIPYPPRPPPHHSISHMWP